MLRNWITILALTVMLGSSWRSVGFSLLGPGGAEAIAAKTWQLPAQNAGWTIGYNFGGDIGSPVAPDEAYRLTLPVITYGYDERFIAFFGTNGIKAVDSAIRILNDRPSTTCPTISPSFH